MHTHAPQLIAELEETARKARITTVEMLCRAGSGHPGGSLSCAEILTCLLHHQAHVSAANPHMPDRDRLVLSKGHAAPMLYTLLAGLGYFARERLDELRTVGAMLQGHPDMTKTPGLDMTSGSLGQGLSVAAGMALGARLDGLKCRIFAVLGDGETNEGQVWEAALFAAHYKLANLTAVIDHNDVQLDGRCDDVLSHDPLPEKWRAFRWNVLLADGHSVAGLLDTLDEAAEHKEEPTVIIAGTIKGKGVSFMEGRWEWHGKTISPDDCRRAVAELRGESSG